MKRIKEDSYVFEGKVDVVKNFDKSITQQNLKEEVDINKIVARAIKTGVLADPDGINRRQAIFGDFSGVESFHSSLNKINAANAAFMELSADVRKRFNHDPAQLMAFMADPNNMEEGIELGLYVRPKRSIPGSQGIDGGAASAPVAGSTPPATPPAA